MKFAHLATRLLNTPLMLHPAKAEIIMAAVADRFGVARILRTAGPSALDPDEFDQEAAAKPYQVIRGIAVIPVQGTLVNRLGMLRPYSGMTGYDGIRACFIDAVSDPAVRGICLDIDSPGGEVSGCFDLVDTVFAARGRKPIHAIVDASAYSAGYALASAADRIVVPRTGGVGSIGVIFMYCDLSKALDEAGVTVNVIQFGARKTDGSELLALPPEGRALFQAQVDAMGTLFVQTVARNRNLAADAVRATEAATYLAADAVRLGLADEVASPDEAFRKLLAAAA